MTTANRRDFIKTATLAGSGLLSGNQLAMGAPQEVTQQSSCGSIAAAGATQPASAFEDVKKVPLAPPDEQPPHLFVPKPVDRKIGYAIVGLGKLALEEVMPAFARCKYSRPVALVSGHPDKAKQVADVYGIDPGNLYNYEDYDRLAENKQVQAIYIILPSSMHAEFTIRGFQAGKHVLCEKPMAVTIEECERMIAAGEKANKKLMIAYRLHYEPFNLQVMDWCKSQKFGEIKTFSSSHCQNVQAPNIRLSRNLGGGPIGDIGIYSINAARYVTGEEPIEVSAISHQPTDDPRFREVPESVTYTLKFPSGVVATCDCSFGTEVSRRYRVHCAKGNIDLDPAFAYTGLKLKVMQSSDGPDGTETQHQFPQINQFASEMDHFSQCILNDDEPNTPGAEGLADMRVMVAIHEAVQTGKTVKVATS